MNFRVRLKNSGTGFAAHGSGVSSDSAPPVRFTWIAETTGETPVPLSKHTLTRISILVLCLTLTGGVWAEGWMLLDGAAAGTEKRLIVRDAQEMVTRITNAAAPGLGITIKPGPDSYPGISLKPDNSATWNLARAGYAEARVANTGTNRLVICMSLEMAEQGKGCAEKVVLPPGAAGTICVYFGYSYGAAVSAFDPGRITQVLLFTKKATIEESFALESIIVAGRPGDRPPVDPESVRVKPANGIIWGGTGPVVVAKQFSNTGGAQSQLSTDGKALQVEFAGGTAQSVTFKPVAGMWNLNEYLEVRVKLKNTGPTPVTPSVRLESEKGPSDVVTAGAPIAPGAEAEIIVPFTARVPWQGVVEHAQEVLDGKNTWGGVPGTGTKYASNTTKGITILSDRTDGAKTLLVTSIMAGLPKYERPAWLGQRPPVAGDWTKTFEDNFDGTTIDLTKWNVYSENYGNQRMHFSKDNVIVKAGKLALRFEKKRGRHNDDPTGKETDYATGWADTYGKWVQRYGYFESRMKLPAGPNRFTAFWLMPDRGLAAGPQNIRASTKEGGMEFDIMETLSIWGIHRHDFGMHWDGYVKYHKSNGDFTFYQQADPEGFITVGMLWTPGLVVMYDNGRETARWESPRISTVPSYIIYDHVMGGWEAEPMDENKLPEDFVIDYVRVWQRQDLASPVDGPKPNKGTPGAPTE